MLQLALCSMHTIETSLRTFTLAQSRTLRGGGEESKNSRFSLKCMTPVVLPGTTGLRHTLTCGSCKTQMQHDAHVEAHPCSQLSCDHQPGGHGPGSAEWSRFGPCLPLCSPSRDQTDVCCRKGYHAGRAHPQGCRMFDQVHSQHIAKDRW
jgi:hypothetical protein